MSWLPDETTLGRSQSAAAQPDPGIVPVYVGDYDYGSAILTKHVTSWVDGRNAINSASQQDAFTDRELVGFAVTTTTPACNSIINTQPTDFIINLSDPVDPATVQASDFTVNGTPADSFVLSNGNTHDYLPLQQLAGDAPGRADDAYSRPAHLTRPPTTIPNLEFNCTFRYAVTPLQVTTTNPPDGGTFSPPAPGDYQYDVNFNEAVDPASVADERSDPERQRWRQRDQCQGDQRQHDAHFTPSSAPSRWTSLST